MARFILANVLCCTGGFVLEISVPIGLILVYSGGVLIGTLITKVKNP